MGVEPIGVVGRRDVVHQPCALHHAEHAGRVAGREAVRAEREIDACVEQAAHRADAGAELEVGKRVVDDRAARLAHQRDVLVGEPDAVGDGGVPVEQAEIVHVADQRLAVEFPAGDRLDLRLENVGVEREAVGAGEGAGRLHQRLGAALGARGRRHETEPAGPAVVARQRRIAERREFLHRRRRLRVDLALQVVRQEIVQIDDRVGQLAVDHVARDGRAQPHILIGLEHGAQGFHGLERELEDVVGEEGDAGLDGVHGAQRRAQIDHARGEFRGAEDAVGEGHPQLQRQVVVAPLGEGFRRVDMAVDETGDHQPVPPRDDPFGLDVGGEGADAGDSLALDQDVALKGRAAVLGIHRDDGGVADQYRHAFDSPVGECPRVTRAGRKCLPRARTRATSDPARWRRRRARAPASGRETPRPRRRRGAASPPNR